MITFCIVIALGFGAASAYSDYTRLSIPNIYALFIGASFIPAFLAVTFYAPELSFFGSWKSHLLSALFMLLVTYAMFHFKLIGGGDSKLLTVFSLWSGVKGLMPLLFFMALVGGILAVSTLLLNKHKPVEKPVKNSWIDIAQKGEKKVPYGIAIFIGAVFAFWHAGYIQPQVLMDLAKETIGS